jgi:hypothetical protein
MKKFTFLLISLMATFMFVTQVNAQSDTLSYSFHEGEFSARATSGYLYQKWVSEDNLVTITTTGYFETSMFASQNFLRTYPGTLTFKAADGYKICGIKACINENNGVTTTSWTYEDGTSDAFTAWKYNYVKKAFDSQTVKIVQAGNSDKEILIYDKGDYKYTYINIKPATTGINNVTTTENTKKEVFDLQGRRVLNPTKGVYIVNGKKVVLK